MYILSKLYIISISSRVKTLGYKDPLRSRDKLTGGSKELLFIYER